MCAAMFALLGNDLLVKMARLAVHNPMAYAAFHGFNAVTQTFDEVDYISYKAVTTPKYKSKKGSDPDYPTYHQAMMRPDADEWKDAMKAETQTLVDINTWDVVPRSLAVSKGKDVIKSTWAFRQKRDAAGQPTKKQGFVSEAILTKMSLSPLPLLFNGLLFEFSLFCPSCTALRPDKLIM
jgi:hypothetical protein